MEVFSQLSASGQISAVYLHAGRQHTDTGSSRRAGPDAGVDCSGPVRWCRAAACLDVHQFGGSHHPFLSFSAPSRIYLLALDSLLPPSVRPPMAAAVLALVGYRIPRAITNPRLLRPVPATAAITCTAEPVNGPRWELSVPGLGPPIWTERRSTSSIRRSSRFLCREHRRTAAVHKLVWPMYLHGRDPVMIVRRDSGAPCGCHQPSPRTT